MRPVLYGYQQSRGQVTIHPQESAIVCAILTAPPGQRASTLRSMIQLFGMTMPESTIKTRIRNVMKRKRYYYIGKCAIHRQPNEALKLL